MKKRAMLAKPARLLNASRRLYVLYRKLNSSCG